MPKYNLEVSDAYLHEFQATGQVEAMERARREAIAYGDDVLLYHGPIVSGSTPICGFDRYGRWFSTR